MSQLAKSWCFTLNNYTDKDIQFFKDITKQYMVVGKEVGESGTPHLQGYIVFNRSYRLPQLKKLHSKVHWEVARAKDADNYCMKDGDYIKEDNRHQGVKVNEDPTGWPLSLAQVPVGQRREIHDHLYRRRIDDWKDCDTPIYQSDRSYARLVRRMNKLFSKYNIYINYAPPNVQIESSQSKDILS